MSGSGAIERALERVLEGFAAGQKAALARAVSIIEDQREGHERLAATIHPKLGRARRLGLTGPPGAGKSTLTTLLAEAYLAAGMKVGVVAVDPTSPFTGGALLGDRPHGARRVAPQRLHPLHGHARLARRARLDDARGL